jgi:hypothetical protein
MPLLKIYVFFLAGERCTPGFRKGGWSEDGPSVLKFVLGEAEILPSTNSRKAKIWSLPAHFGRERSGLVKSRLFD